MQDTTTIIDNIFIADSKFYISNVGLFQKIKPFLAGSVYICEYSRKTDRLLNPLN